jgi:hypothetical protein
MRQDPDNAEDDLQGWLREHPEAHGDLADLHRLRELYQSVNLPQPEEAAWAPILTRIRDAVPAVNPQRKHSPRPLWTMVSLTAAAILAGILLTRVWWIGVPHAQPQPQPQPQLTEEPFPVAEADDVTIISMDARDVAALVVGEPPVSGDLEFVRAADIRVIKCERCPKSGNVPRLAQGEVPMLVTSVARVDEPEE